MVNNANLEFLHLKVFLYKYTPPFTQQSSSSVANAVIDKYTIPLEPQYFTKYDITNFVSAYNFQQTVNENTFTWSILLQEKVLSFEELDKFAVTDGTNTFSNLTKLSQYESQAKNISDVSTIETAKLLRGQTQSEFVIKQDFVTQLEDGLRLSDIIQPYDFISCFLYKSSKPLEEVRGTRTISEVHGLPIFTETLNGNKITSDDLRFETVILSLEDFSNEFNGFILTKNVTRTTGNVDTITLSGSGLTKLFGSTRRIMKGDVGQDSLYTRGENTDPNVSTAFGNVYADKSILQIFTDLFNIVYRITIDEKNTVSTPSGLTNLSFYNATKLVASNILQTNLFVIPPYLLTQVMKLRGFNYVEPNFLGTSQISSIVTANRSNVEIEQTLNSLPGTFQTKQLRSTPPVYISRELNSLTAYFKYIQDVLSFFNPELNTPFEIIDDIKSRTFLEFIERPTGIVIIRPPQYNDLTTTIFSSDIDVISTTYTEDACSLISRQKMGYSVDGNPINQEGLFTYAYTDGKLLAQYGWLEGTADENPNVKDDKPKNTDLSIDKTSGLFKYAEYFLRIYNAGLRTGEVVANLNNKVQVGMTFFDEKNKKFGYITSVTKSVNILNATTMRLEIDYVRDAFLADPSVKDASTIEVEQLPRLVDIASGFSSTSDTSVKDPGPVKQ